MKQVFLYSMVTSQRSRIAFISSSLFCKAFEEGKETNKLVKKIQCEAFGTALKKGPPSLKLYFCLVGLFAEASHLQILEFSLKIGCKNVRTIHNSVDAGALAHQMCWFSNARVSSVKWMNITLKYTLLTRILLCFDCSEIAFTYNISFVCECCECFYKNTKILNAEL